MHNVAAPVVKITVALLLISLVLVNAPRADASSSLTTELTKEVSATFETDVDGIRTSIEIVVAETQTISPEGTDSGLHASMEVLQLDSRGRETRFIDVGGGTEAPPGSLSLSEDLSAASLQVTVPVCGAKVLHKGRLKQRAFGACFDVQVDLTWTGSGQVDSASGTDDYEADDCTVHLESAYSRRNSSAAGAVRVGSTNFAPGKSTSGVIGTSTHTTSVTCPD